MYKHTIRLVDNALGSNIKSTKYVFSKLHNYVNTSTCFETSRSMSKIFTFSYF